MRCGYEQAGDSIPLSRRAELIERCRSEHPSEIESDQGYSLAFGVQNEYAGVKRIERANRRLSAALVAPHLLTRRWRNLHFGYTGAKAGGGRARGTGQHSRGKTAQKAHRHRSSHDLE